MHMQGTKGKQASTQKCKHDRLSSVRPAQSKDRPAHSLRQAGIKTIKFIWKQENKSKDGNGKMKNKKQAKTLEATQKTHKETLGWSYMRECKELAKTNGKTQT